jgi:hypothetical protein
MSERWARGLRGLGLCGVLVACGGRAQLLDAAGGSTAVAVSGTGGAGGIETASSGSGGVSMVLGGAASTSAAGEGGAPSSMPLGCPDPALQASCPELNVDLVPTSAEKTSDPAVWVEPLQVPNFDMTPPGYFPPVTHADPASWDHSPVPAGACVFRLHNAGSNCLRPGRVYLESCASFLAAEPGAAHVVPVSFYETSRCEQGIAPGCPSSDPWSSEGIWWYELPHGADLDVVVCAPLCANEFVGSACLRLPPVGP